MPGSAAELSGDIPRTYIGNSSDSEYHFNVLREWLVGCQSRSHAVCNMTMPGDVVIDDNYRVPLPSRLISVGYPGDKMVYLRETKGEKGAYITLSYVWGGPSRIPKTTSANIEQRENGMLVKSLPKTFQDVITIARKLNVPYVWIDALCIIQDDEEDWKREVGQMSRIYQFSLLTVAATGAEDASRGCFLNRAPTSLEIGSVITLPYRTKEGVARGDFMLFEQHTTFAEEYDRFVEKSPLLKRGWVFQERVISRRMVHYTRGRIFFECRTHRFMNECQEGISKEETQLGFWGPEIKVKSFPKKVPNQFEATILGRWYMAIKIYTQLRLTKTSDKLAAVAGVAREFQVLLSKEKEKAGKTSRDGSALHTPLYVSGLWSHDLLYGLSWYPSMPAKIRIAGNKAPSWSWASWHTPILWPGVLTFKPECKVIVVEMLEQYKRGGSSQTMAKQRGKASELSSFEADLPRGVTLETTTTFLSELKVTGKIREVWRRPHISKCLSNVERKEFSDLCEMSVDERYWLQCCHAVYVEENAVKPAGYGCFEDHWLAKSLDSLTFSEVGNEVNGGLEEAEAIALLLSMQGSNADKRKFGPRNSADNDLELAIAASLGKEPPRKAAPKQVDLDQEFSDQLAIALMVSAEESSKSRNSSLGTAEEEDAKNAELGEISRQAEGPHGGTNDLEYSSTSVDTNRDTRINPQPPGEPDGGHLQVDSVEEHGISLPNGNKSQPTEELSAEGQSTEDEIIDVNATEGTDSSEPHSSTAPQLGGSKSKQQEVHEEATDSEPFTEDDHSSLGHLTSNHSQIPPYKDQKRKQKLNSASQLSSNHQPQIPSRTSSSQPSNIAQPNLPSNHSAAPNDHSLHIPAKLHFLPLYSTKATGSLSYLGLSATVYTVLFLRAAGDREGIRVFERVGVGKITEKGLFGAGKTETAVLI
jgi:hypothetical protein